MSIKNIFIWTAAVKDVFFCKMTSMNDMIHDFSAKKNSALVPVACQCQVMLTKENTFVETVEIGTSLCSLVILF